MDGFIETRGRTPKTDGPFMVQFRSGWISGPFKRDQLRWRDEGTQWCVVRAQPVSEGTATETKPPCDIAREALAA